MNFKVFINLKNNKKGDISITTVLVVTSILFTIAAGLIITSLNTVNATKGKSNATAAEFRARLCLDDSLNKVKASNYSSGVAAASTYPDGGQCTSTITDTSSTVKNIAIAATVSGYNYDISKIVDLSQATLSPNPVIWQQTNTTTQNSDDQNSAYNEAYSSNGSTIGKSTTPFYTLLSQSATISSVDYKISSTGLATLDVTAKALNSYDTSTLTSIISYSKDNGNTFTQLSTIPVVGSTTNFTPTSTTGTISFANSIGSNILVRFTLSGTPAAAIGTGQTGWDYLSFDSHGSQITFIPRTNDINVDGKLFITPKIPLAATGSVATANYPIGVFVQGRYAYITSVATNTLKIYDVSNSSSPVNIGSVGTGSNPIGISVQGRYAYVANNGSNTLQIFDVSNPSSPTSVGLVGTGTNPDFIYVQGKYVYLTNNGSSTLQIFDVTTPSSPVNVGSVATGTNPIGIYVQGKYAYIVNSSGNTLQIFDISNPISPVSVGSVATSANPYQVYVQGRYAYIVNNASNTLQIFDISNPVSPVSVGSVATGTTPYTLSVQGQYAYAVNNTTNTLQIFNVSNPASPVSVGSVATGANPNGIFVQGRYAYVISSSGNTLQIFDLGGAYIQQLEAGGIETGTLNVRNNLNAVDGSFTGGLNVSQSLNVSQDLAVNGNLGIGTPSSSYKLNINGNTKALGQAIFVSSGINTTPLIAQGISGQNTDIFQVQNNFGTSLSSFDLSGNLHVANTVYTLDGTNLTLRAGSTATKSNIQLLSNTNYVGINNGPDAASTYGLLNLGAGGFSGGANNFSGNTNGTVLAINGSTSADLLNLQQLGVNKFVVKSTGNTGVGTLSPITQFHVPGRVPTGAAGSLSVFNAGSIYIQGRYGYFGAQNLFKIVDVSDPTNIVALGSLSVTGNAGKVVVSGKYAYLSLNSFPTGLINIIDISNPNTPVLVSSTVTTGDTDTLYIQGRYLYTGDHSGTSNKFAIYDISNPVSPVSIYSTVQDTVDIYVQGRYAYLVSVTPTTALVIYDVSNPYITSSVASLTLAAGAAPNSIYVQGKYVYIANSGRNTIQIIDVSNPATPVSVSTFTVGTTPDAIYVQGRYAYILNNGTTTLQIIDISTPASPVSIGTTTTGPSPFGLFVQGRYAYTVGSGNSSPLLQSFDIGGSYIQQLESGGIETGTLNVRNNLQALDGNFTGGLQIGQSLQVNQDLGLNGFINQNAKIGTTNSIFNLTATNTNSTSTASSVKAFNLNLVGNANANANANTITGINFTNTTALANNTFNGITFGTGYNNFLTSSTINISAAGAITGTTGITNTGFVTTSKIAGNSATPSQAAGAAAGTSPTLTSIGTDIAGQISLTTGTTPTTGVLATITFSSTYTTSPYVLLFPVNANAAALSSTSSIYATSTPTTLVLNSGSVALAASTVYVWNYIVIK